MGRSGLWETGQSADGPDYVETGQLHGRMGGEQVNLRGRPVGKQVNPLAGGRDCGNRSTLQTA